MSYGEKESWLVSGDFNEVAFSWEARGLRNINQRNMRRFREVLEFNQLEDLGFKGEPFTFSNRRKNDKETRSRIDRDVATPL